MEIWKDIPDYKGYQASSLGNIRSLDRWIVHGEGNNKVKQFFEGTEMSCWNRKGKGGRKYVTLGTRYGNKIVARLVCMAFNGPPPDDSYVCHHKDDDHTNDIPSNLEWMTKKDHDKLHGIDNFKGNLIGSEYSKKPITLMEVSTGKITHYESGRDVEKHTNLTNTNVSCLRTGRVKTSKGYQLVK